MIDKVLIVDDEMLVREFISETLQRNNVEVSAAENGQKAIAMLKENTYDLIFTDMKMPDLTGIDVLKKAKELSPNSLVVIITAFGSIENAVEAMKLGAFNYLIKPFSPDTIEAVLEKAKTQASLIQENIYLRQRLSEEGNFQNVIGESPTMKKIFDQVVQVAKSNASVFITGESGTGKEVIASAIHVHSLRSNRPFIKVNCAAIPETLIESEFFGHEKGAFTGATSRRLGRFELANEGTLLLDEVTEIPLLLQAKLLRAIQEQEFERVGGTKPVKVDVRLISTSNRDMKEAIREKLIREDLFYRLNVVPIYLPPLRERKEDISPLAEYFIAKYSIENHRERKTLTPEAQQKLMAYHWPGNIRELANIIERAVVMSNNTQILPSQIILDFGEFEEKKRNQEFSSIFQLFPKGVTLQELEKKLIIETLAAQQNDRIRAAEALGITVQTLQTKLQEHRLYNPNS